MAEPSLNDTETRLVERYVWVLDLMGRVAQGVDRGDWYYLADKADDLRARAEKLAEVAEEIQKAVRDGKRPVRPEAVHVGVAYYGRHYRAGRLLHPLKEGE
jgi:hypothetical protein